MNAAWQARRAGKGASRASPEPRRRDSVEALFQLKARPEGQGSLLLGAEWSRVEPYVDTGLLSAERYAEMRASWPGPFTWVAPRSARTPPWLVGEHRGVAVRVTAHAPAAALCRAAGTALVSTSANPHGMPAATTTQQVLGYFGAALAGVLDAPGGTLEGPTPIRDAITGQYLRS
ncbi:Sua5/YciO/YrdC/YwlC family protein [uncultured Piscinibacter sp.]|uniref:Sua5/YciO/YrdC/YwlC family protein n=1 Tax=uncultured Piscinibacter sp. TaxID=1131835 RepID=UPI00345C4D75